MTNEEAIKHGKEQLEIFGGEHKEFIIKTIQAIESQRPTGKWINEKDVGNGNRSVECSNCGAGDEQAWLQKVPYCWKCGAKMEVEE